MELVRWNPMRDMIDIRQRQARLMENFFFPEQNPNRENALWDWNPRVDIPKPEEDKAKQITVH